ncbi:S-adenosyl-L-methionine-dependent methyltransferase [Tribonema minus]|uniref:S-adenosyl-L-methionine-dependent methyltransferase n=1 Tax=Tribonema minus TaxID=303371 RepID=A0A836CD04_9STRA|nr:S-adenosyl-L-methionine-dependent methyltransferase [Tribonema minus]
MPAEQDQSTPQQEQGHPRWENIWAAGLKKGDAFDTGRVSPALQQLLDAQALPKGRALVPGCGRGYDAIAFGAAGYDATGLDLSKTGIQAATALLAETEPKPAGPVQFVVGNFFEFGGDGSGGRFDVILDYTFLCALDPSIRQQWAQRMAALLAPGGELVTLIFPIGKPLSEGGPPFGVTLDLLTELLTPVGLEAVEELKMLPDELCHPTREKRTGLGRWRLKA